MPDEMDQTVPEFDEETLHRTIPSNGHAMHTQAPPAEPSIVDELESVRAKGFARRDELLDELARLDKALGVREVKGEVLTTTGPEMPPAMLPTTTRRSRVAKAPAEPKAPKAAKEAAEAKGRTFRPTSKPGRILAYLQAEGAPRSPAQVAKATKIKVSDVSQALLVIRKAGYIEQTGKRPAFLYAAITK
jgi:DNA-binding IclR family transcriptional regulator